MSGVSPEMKKPNPAKRRDTVIVISLGLVAILFIALPSRGRQIAHALSAPYAITDSQFLRSLDALVGPQLAGGNRIDVLQNGDETYPAMLEAIRSARRTITFESAYFRKGEMTHIFAQALAERARAGVKVHALIDWTGTEKLRRDDLHLMRDAGVEVMLYHKPHFWRPRSSADRSHRRILVIDGRTGFTGGVCIADEWRGHGQDHEHWRDIHFRLQGPVVAQLQAAFMDNWREERGTVLHGDDYFPRLDPVGSMPAQVVTSSPDEGSENVRMVYLLSIAAARGSIMIENPYFVPDDVMRDALLDARHRGVSVSIILPADSATDAHLTAKASRSRWGPLLEAGAHIYQYPITLLHQKLMIVDSVFVTAGSANFDNRSFRLNDEVNFDTFDAAFARHLAAIFMDDRAKSIEYTRADWVHRSWKERAVERFAAIFRAQL
jgi:cardiolipin synthase